MSTSHRSRSRRPPGDRIRLELSNNDSLVADAPMTHWYGRKVGTDTYHHSAERASFLRMHERPRPTATPPANAGTTLDATPGEDGADA